MLSNPYYQDAYAYIPARYPKRGSYAISEYKDKRVRKIAFDMVRLVVDLPYLPAERARAMVFNTPYLFDEYLQANFKKKVSEGFAKLLKNTSLKEE